MTMEDTIRNEAKSSKRTLNHLEGREIEQVGHSIEREQRHYSRLDCAVRRGRNPGRDGMQQRHSMQMHDGVDGLELSTSSKNEADW
jgi:hypothetical protein